MNLPAAFVLCLLASLAARAENAPKTPSPAEVSRPVTESELVRVTLTPEAERRLGIAVEPVKTRESSRRRLVGAEVILPLTSSTGEAPETSASPGALLQATTPSELLRLAQGQIDADVQVELARIQVEVAEKALARALQMLQDKAGAMRVAVPDHPEALPAARSEEARRFYPNRELAAHVLGFANIDGEGIEGIELSYDCLLYTSDAADE